MALIRKRLIFAAVMSVASFGCGDDDAEHHDGGARDAGSDAAIDDATDADVPAMDARVTDGSDGDASGLSDAGDGGACLEASYIWEQFTVCSGERTLYSARRVTLTEFCETLDCPPNWNAALAAAADECDEETDAGPDPCWTASTECGSNFLRTHSGPDEGFLYYDPVTGELTGAANQFTDESIECVASEIIAGERPPLCCEVPDAG